MKNLNCEELLEGVAEPILVVSKEGDIFYKNQEMESLKSIIGINDFREIINYILGLKYVRDGLNVKGIQKELKGRVFQIDCYNYRDKVLIFLRDITRVVKLEEEIKKEGSISSFSKLLAELFHDLKGPIAGLKAATQYIKENPNETDLLEDMLSDIERIEKFLKDVMDITKPINLSLKKENIHIVIEKVLNRIKIIYPNLNTVRNYDPSIPDLMIDPDYIQRVIYNIIQNGVEEAGEDGTIWVETGVSSDPIYSPKMDKVYLRIKDSGRGVPQEIEDKIFLPFFSTKPSGTGVGLANAYNIVKSHSGILRYVKNSTFEILLPIR
ncbi:MAG: ATP-binding protein [Hydrogenothermaceae bacterium]|nr:ATP-binding protein [Hydrogenothermaceae bacterium]